MEGRGGKEGGTGREDGGGEGGRKMGENFGEVEEQWGRKEHEQGKREESGYEDTWSNTTDLCCQMAILILLWPTTLVKTHT